MDQMYGTKGSSDSDTAIWDDADRQTKPYGKALGSSFCSRISAVLFRDRAAFGLYENRGTF